MLEIVNIIYEDLTCDIWCGIDPVGDSMTKVQWPRERRCLRHRTTA